MGDFLSGNGVQIASELHVLGPRNVAGRTQSRIVEAPMLFGRLIVHAVARHAGRCRIAR